MIGDILPTIEIDDSLTTTIKLIEINPESKNPEKKQNEESKEDIEETTTTRREIKGTSDETFIIDRSLKKRKQKNHFKETSHSTMKPKKTLRHFKKRKPKKLRPIEIPKISLKTAVNTKLKSAKPAQIKKTITKKKYSNNDQKTANVKKILGTEKPLKWKFKFKKANEGVSIENDYRKLVEEAFVAKKNAGEDFNNCSETANEILTTTIEKNEETVETSSTTTSEGTIEETTEYLTETEEETTSIITEEAKEEITVSTEEITTEITTEKTKEETNDETVLTEEIIIKTTSEETKEEITVSTDEMTTETTTEKTNEEANDETVLTEETSTGTTSEESIKETISAQTNEETSKETTALTVETTIETSTEGTTTTIDEITPVDNPFAYTYKDNINETQIYKELTEDAFTIKNSNTNENCPKLNLKKAVEETTSIENDKTLKQDFEDLSVEDDIVETLMNGKESNNRNNENKRTNNERGNTIVNSNVNQKTCISNSAVSINPQNYDFKGDKLGNNKKCDEINTHINRKSNNPTPINDEFAFLLTMTENQQTVSEDMKESTKSTLTLPIVLKTTNPTTRIKKLPIKITTTATPSTKSFTKHFLKAFSKSKFEENEDMVPKTESVTKPEYYKREEGLIKEDHRGSPKKVFHDKLFFVKETPFFKTSSTKKMTFFKTTQQSAFRPKKHGARHYTRMLVYRNGDCNIVESTSSTPNKNGEQDINAFFDSEEDKEKFFEELSNKVLDKDSEVLKDEKKGCEINKTEASEYSGDNGEEHKELSSYVLEKNTEITENEEKVSSECSGGNGEVETPSILEVITVKSIQEVSEDFKDGEENTSMSGGASSIDFFSQKFNSLDSEGAFLENTVISIEDRENATPLEREEIDVEEEQMESLKSSSETNESDENKEKEELTSAFTVSTPFNERELEILLATNIGLNFTDLNLITRDTNVDLDSNFIPVTFKYTPLDVEGNVASEVFTEQNENTKTECTENFEQTKNSCENKEMAGVKAKIKLIIEDTNSTGCANTENDAIIKIKSPGVFKKEKVGRNLISIILEVTVATEAPKETGSKTTMVSEKNTRSMNNIKLFQNSRNVKTDDQNILQEGEKRQLLKLFSGESKKSCKDQTKTCTQDYDSVFADIIEKKIYNYLRNLQNKKARKIKELHNSKLPNVVRKTHSLKKTAKKPIFKESWEKLFRPHVTTTDIPTFYPPMKTLKTFDEDFEMYLKPRSLKRKTTGKHQKSLQVNLKWDEPYKKIKQQQTTHILDSPTEIYDDKMAMFSSKHETSTLCEICEETEEEHKGKQKTGIISHKNNNVVHKKVTPHKQSNETATEMFDEELAHFSGKHETSTLCEICNETEEEHKGNKKINVESHKNINVAHKKVTTKKEKNETPTEAFNEELAHFSEKHETSTLCELCDESYSNRKSSKEEEKETKYSIESEEKTSKMIVTVSRKETTTHPYEEIFSKEFSQKTIFEQTETSGSVPEEISSKKTSQQEASTKEILGEISNSNTNNVPFKYLLGETLTSAPKETNTLVLDESSTGSAEEEAGHTLEETTEVTPVKEEVTLTHSLEEISEEIENVLTSTTEIFSLTTEEFSLNSEENTNNTPESIEEKEEEKSNQSEVTEEHEYDETTNLEEAETTETITFETLPEKKTEVEEISTTLTTEEPSIEVVFEVETTTENNRETEEQKYEESTNFREAETTTLPEEHPKIQEISTTLATEGPSIEVVFEVETTTVYPSEDSAFTETPTQNEIELALSRQMELISEKYEEISKKLEEATVTAQSTEPYETETRKHKAETEEIKIGEGETEEHRTHSHMEEETKNIPTKGHEYESQRHTEEHEYETNKHEELKTEEISQKTHGYATHEYTNEMEEISTEHHKHRTHKHTEEYKEISNEEISTEEHKHIKTYKHTEESEDILTERHEYRTHENEEESEDQKTQKHTEEAEEIFTEKHKHQTHKHTEETEEITVEENTEKAEEISTEEHKHPTHEHHTQEELEEIITEEYKHKTHKHTEAEELERITEFEEHKHKSHKYTEEAEETATEERKSKTHKHLEESEKKHEHTEEIYTERYKHPTHKHHTQEESENTEEIATGGQDYETTEQTEEISGHKTRQHTEEAEKISTIEHKHKTHRYTEETEEIVTEEHRHETHKHTEEMKAISTEEYEHKTHEHTEETEEISTAEYEHKTQKHTETEEPEQITEVEEHKHKLPKYTVEAEVTETEHVYKTKEQTEEIKKHKAHQHTQAPEEISTEEHKFKTHKHTEEEEFSTAKHKQKTHKLTEQTEEPKHTEESVENKTQKHTGKTEEIATVETKNADEVEQETRRQTEGTVEHETQKHAEEIEDTSTGGHMHNINTEKTGGAEEAEETEFVSVETHTHTEETEHETQNHEHETEEISTEEHEHTKETEEISTETHKHTKKPGHETHKHTEVTEAPETQNLAEETEEISTEEHEHTEETEEVSVEIPKHTEEPENETHKHTEATEERETQNRAEDTEEISTAEHEHTKETEEVSMETPKYTEEPENETHQHTEATEERETQRNEHETEEISTEEHEYTKETEEVSVEIPKHTEELEHETHKHTEATEERETQKHAEETEEISTEEHEHTKETEEVSIETPKHTEESTEERETQRNEEETVEISTEEYEHTKETEEVSTAEPEHTKEISSEESGHKTHKHTEETEEISTEKHEHTKETEEVSVEIPKHTEELEHETHKHTEATEERETQKHAEETEEISTEEHEHTKETEEVSIETPKHTEESHEERETQRNEEETKEISTEEHEHTKETEEVSIAEPEHTKEISLEESEHETHKYTEETVKSETHKHTEESEKVSSEGPKHTERISTEKPEHKTHRHTDENLETETQKHAGKTEEVSTEKLEHTKENTIKSTHKTAIQTQTLKHEETHEITEGVTPEQTKTTYKNTEAHTTITHGKKGSSGETPKTTENTERYSTEEIHEVSEQTMSFSGETVSLEIKDTTTQTNKKMQQTSTKLEEHVTTVKGKETETTTISTKKEESSTITTEKTTESITTNTEKETHQTQTQEKVEISISTESIYEVQTSEMHTEQSTHVSEESKSSSNVEKGETITPNINTENAEEISSVQEKTTENELTTISLLTFTEETIKTKENEESATIATETSVGSRETTNEIIPKQTKTTLMTHGNIETESTVIEISSEETISSLSSEGTEISVKNEELEIPSLTSNKEEIESVTTSKPVTEEASTKKMEEKETETPETTPIDIVLHTLHENVSVENPLGQTTENLELLKKGKNKPIQTAEELEVQPGEFVKNHTFQPLLETQTEESTEIELYLHSLSEKTTEGQTASFNTEGTIEENEENESVGNKHTTTITLLSETHESSTDLFSESTAKETSLTFLETEKSNQFLEKNLLDLIRSSTIPEYLLITSTEVVGSNFLFTTPVGFDKNAQGNNKGTCGEIDYNQRKGCLCSIQTLLETLKENMNHKDFLFEFKHPCPGYVKINKTVSLDNSTKPIVWRKRRSLSFVEEHKTHKREIISNALIDQVLGEELNVVNTDFKTYSTIGSHVKIPCSPVDEIPVENQKPVYSWAHSDGTSIKGGKLQFSGGYLVMESVSAEDNGNYTCTITLFVDGNNEVKTFNHELIIISMPTFAVNTNILYGMSKNCELTDTDLLATYMPNLLKKLLCKNEITICDVQIHHPHCVHKDVSDKYIAVSLTVSMEPLDTILNTFNATICDINCQMKIYSKIASFLVKNVEVVSNLQVVSRVGEKQMNLTPTAMVVMSEKVNQSDVTEAPSLAVTCPPGFGLLKAQTRICMICAKNTYSSATDSFCKPCPVGQYQPNVASKSCLVCSSPLQDKNCLRVIYANGSNFRLYVGFAFAFMVLLLIVVGCCGSGAVKKKNSYEERYTKYIGRKFNHDIERQQDVRPLLRPKKYDHSKAKAPPNPPPLDIDEIG